MSEGSEAPVGACVHVVVMESGGLFGMYVDKEEIAKKCAQAIDGVVFSIPVSHDYRKADDET
jgi:hypothetical protein